VLENLGSFDGLSAREVVRACLILSETVPDLSRQALDRSCEKICPAPNEPSKRPMKKLSELQQQAIWVSDRLRDWMLIEKVSKIEDIHLDWMHGVVPLIRYEYEDERSHGMTGPRVVFPQLCGKHQHYERPYKIPTEVGLKKFLAYVESLPELAWLHEPVDLLA
jgi:hypothetical protein